MAVRVKHMNITYLAEASALAIQAMDYLEAASRLPAGSGTSHHHHDRLFELAMNKYVSAPHLSQRERDPDQFLQI